MSNCQRISLGWIVFHDDAEIRQHQESWSLDAGRHQQECFVVGPPKWLAVCAFDSLPLPVANAHESRMIGEQKIERRRHYDLVAPSLASNPTVFFQIVSCGSNDVRHRVNDIAAAVPVEIHCIFLE